MITVLIATKAIPPMLADIPIIQKVVEAIVKMTEPIVVTGTVLTDARTVILLSVLQKTFTDVEKTVPILLAAKQAQPIIVTKTQPSAEADVI